MMYAVDTIFFRGYVVDGGVARGCGDEGGIGICILGWSCVRGWVYIHRSSDAWSLASELAELISPRPILFTPAHTLQPTRSLTGDFDVTSPRHSLPYT